jgi:hypothetical protein
MRCVAGTSLSTEAEHSKNRRTGQKPDLMETHGMDRIKEMALRLAVVTAFVLVLAAPFRW